MADASSVAASTAASATAMARETTLCFASSMSWRSSVIRIAPAGCGRPRVLPEERGVEDELLDLGLRGHPRHEDGGHEGQQQGRRPPSEQVKDDEDQDDRRRQGRNRQPGQVARDHAGDLTDPGADEDVAPEPDVAVVRGDTGREQPAAVPRGERDEVPGPAAERDPPRAARLAPSVERLAVEKELRGEINAVDKEPGVRRPPCGAAGCDTTRRSAPRVREGRSAARSASTAGLRRGLHAPRPASRRHRRANRPSGTPTLRRGARDRRRGLAQGRRGRPLPGTRGECGRAWRAILTRLAPACQHFLLRPRHRPPGPRRG